MSGSVLHVSGVTIRKDLEVKGDITMSGSGKKFDMSGSDLDVSGVTIRKDLTVKGDITMSGSGKKFDMSGSDLDVSGVTIRKDLTVKGDITISGKLLISEPRVVGKTSIYPDVINYHRFGYGDGQNNTGPFVNNFFYMPHIDFKVIFTPLSPITQYKIRCFIDAYYAGTTYYFALSTSTSPLNIIPQTITLMRGRWGEWSSRQEEFCVTEFNTSIETYTLHTRYVFVKEVLVSATNTLSSSETIANTGWILWGGKASHNSAIQTKFYYNQDLTPHTPPDHDNFGPLEIEAWSIPTGSYGTNEYEDVQFKYLEY